MQRALARALLLSTLAVPLGPAGAALAADPLTLSFEVWWGGLQAARIAFIDEQDMGGYRDRLSIRTLGVVRWLTGIDFDGEGSGARGRGGLTPLYFTQRSTTKDKERTIALTFGDGAALKTRDEERPLSGGPATAPVDPPIPAELMKGVYDPVSALVELGRRSVDGMPRFTLPVYDGRRRFDLDVTVVGADRHDIDGKTYDTIDVRAVFHPIAGFKSHYAEIWDNTVFDIYVGRDLKLPLWIATDSFSVSTVISIRESCPSPGCGQDKHG